MSQYFLYLVQKNIFWQDQIKVEYLIISVMLPSWLKFMGTFFFSNKSVLNRWPSVTKWIAARQIPKLVASVASCGERKQIVTSKIGMQLS